MRTRLSSAHQSTHDAIYQHPVARNLNWREVRSMLEAVADLVAQPNGKLKFTRNGQTLTLHPKREKDVADVEELMEIRHFLDRSDDAPEQAATAGQNLLVVIDHRKARIYRAELSGSVPQRISPYEPHATPRQLLHTEPDAGGQRKPELGSFYEAVAKTLRGAERVLVFGNGTGASSAMDHLIAELKRRHPDIAARVIGAIVVDARHLSDDQLLARAREFCETSGAPLLLSS
jgi:hypothetical protein